jgi:TPR repeat protein
MDNGSDVLYRQALAARRLLDEGRISEAILELENLSAAGEQFSQVTLGWIHDIGKGVAVDTLKAERLYSAAAETGYRVGQYYLGSLLVREHRDAEAVGWFNRAFDQGYAPAGYRLGWMYSQGRGVCRDECIAERYMKMAAEGGHLFAQRWIARRDLSGRNGVLAFARALLFFASVPVLAVRFVSDDSKDPNLAPM